MGLFLIKKSFHLFSANSVGLSRSDQKIRCRKRSDTENRSESASFEMEIEGSTINGFYRNFHRSWINKFFFDSEDLRLLLLLIFDYIGFAWVINDMCVPIFRVPRLLLSTETQTFSRPRDLTAWLGCVWKESSWNRRTILSTCERKFDFFRKRFCGNVCIVKTRSCSSSWRREKFGKRFEDSLKQ